MERTTRPIFFSNIHSHRWVHGTGNVAKQDPVLQAYFDTGEDGDLGFEKAMKSWLTNDTLGQHFYTSSQEGNFTWFLATIHGVALP